LRSLVLAFVGFCTTLSAGRAHADPPRRVAKASPESDLGAYRAAPKPSFEAVLGRADADGDGRVTGAELEAFVLSRVKLQIAARFRRLDRNQDGLVARSEVPTMDGARFARFDVNGDQRLVAAELERVIRSQALARCRSVFARLDLDRDGAISAFEREAGDHRQARR
jgi:hypothetical protein